MPLNLISCRLSAETLPPPAAMYEYAVAGNGLFVRAEDDRLSACVPLAAAVCPGLPRLKPDVRLKLPRIPAMYLAAILESARRKLPNEAAYQFLYDAPLSWRCVCPDQAATPASVDYADNGLAVVDLHSHGSMAAFFSETDNADEGGLRFYAVAGCVDSATPQIAVRVGVYGHHYAVPAERVFAGAWPFVDTFFGKELE